MKTSTHAIFVCFAAVQIACGSRTLTVVEKCPDTGATTFSSCPNTSTPLRGLVGHWQFDDGAGNTMAHDSSGNGNNGSLVDLDPATAWVTGHVGSYALNTNGVGYAQVARSPSIDSIVDQVSLAAWMYLDGPVVDYATAASRHRPNSVYQYYHIAINQDLRPSLFIQTTEPTNKVTQLLGPVGQQVPRQQWIHIAGTYDGAEARLYLDGVLVTARPIDGDFPVDTTSFILGGNGNVNVVTERFPGRIDEIVLYNRALDEGEIRQLATRAFF